MLLVFPEAVEATGVPRRNRALPSGAVQNPREPCSDGAATLRRRRPLSLII